jgi:hypothetical protein
MLPPEPELLPPEPFDPPDALASLPLALDVTVHAPKPNPRVAASAN